MCTPDCIGFGRKYLALEEVKGRRVIEVGSYNVNGSLRPVIEPMGPSEYIGVDIERGCGVDVICRAEDVRERFGDESFDLVVSTELIEHVLDWRKVVSNIKNICRPGAVALITTRSLGFEYHGWPFDFWRYETDDMREIFSDFDIERIGRDETAPGVFIKLIKPVGFREKDLSSVSLYSVVECQRTLDLDTKVLNAFLQRNQHRVREIEKMSFRAKASKAKKDISWMIGKGKVCDLFAYAFNLLRA